MNLIQRRSFLHSLFASPFLAGLAAFKRPAPMEEDQGLSLTREAAIERALGVAWNHALKPKSVVWCELRREGSKAFWHVSLGMLTRTITVVIAANEAANSAVIPECRTDGIFDSRIAALNKRFTEQHRVDHFDLSAYLAENSICA